MNLLRGLCVALVLTGSARADIILSAANVTAAPGETFAVFVNVKGQESASTNNLFSFSTDFVISAQGGSSPGLLTFAHQDATPNPGYYPAYSPPVTDSSYVFFNNSFLVINGGYDPNDPSTWQASVSTTTDLFDTYTVLDMVQINGSPADVGFSTGYTLAKLWLTVDPSATVGSSYVINFANEYFTYDGSNPLSVVPNPVFSVTVGPAVVGVPEPSGMVLISVGLGVLGTYRRKMRR